MVLDSKPFLLLPSSHTMMAHWCIRWSTVPRTAIPWSLPLTVWLLVLGLSSCALLASAGRPAVGLDARAQESIDLLIEETMRCRGIPGLSMSVATSNDVIMERGYGYADLASSREVTSQTLFPIASTTKAFTVTLLAIILENHPQK